MTTSSTDDTQLASDSAIRRLVFGGSTLDIIGRSRLWLIISAVLMTTSLLGLGVRGLDFSIDFTGGSSFLVEGATAEFTAEQLRDRLTELGVTDATVQVVDDGAGALISTPEVEEVAGTEQRELVDAIAQTTGADVSDVVVSAVGPRWGEQITRQALVGLAVFLALVVLYITLRFELRMAAAALVTLLHDIVVTIGLYVIFGFTVSPASVIALLTILGYSLYDTVVVFDRISEDAAQSSTVAGRSYGEVANDSLNAVLIRSLSTSVTSLLPVGALLVVGTTLLGAATLSDLAIALFIGMGVGTYSSIVVAAPTLVWLKEKEPRLAERKQRRAARGRAS